MVSPDKNIARDQRISRDLVIILLLVLPVSACRMKPAAVEPAIIMPSSFSMQGTNPLPEKWWESLRDPALNDLIEEAVTNNFTIRSAWDRLYQAEQVAIKAGAAGLPNVTYSGSARRTRQETGNVTTYTNRFQLGATASYELDLWGAIHSSRQAAVLDAEARQEDLSAAAITLSAAVAKTWYQLAETRQQIAVLARQIQANEEVLQIVSLQFQKARVGAADVLRQRQLVESTRGQQVLMQETEALLQHQLSVLLGRAPVTDWDGQDIALASLPDLPSLEIPSEWVQRRPDVASAYKAVQAADQRMAVAAADRYPSIGLTANAEATSTRVEDLFNDWAGYLAGFIAGPLFDAGLRRAEVERTRGVLSQAVHTYTQTVLNALQEVEDALSKEAYQQDYLHNVQTQRVLAEQVYESTRRRYINGQVDYLRVLDALVSLQTLERSELRAYRDLLDVRIDLCRAIAGPWDMERPEPARLDKQ
jgi:NodT family efflux transporter outer membrane factor (OMF) lipoprotein